MEGNKAKRNDNKTLKESSANELLKITLRIGNKSLTRLEKVVLEEVLINRKTFSEIEGNLKLTPFRLKQLFNVGFRRLKDNLLYIDEGLSEAENMKNTYDNSQAELANVKWELEKLNEKIKAKDELKPEIKNLISTSIYDLNLSARIQNMCKAADIETLADLVRIQRREFTAFRNIGEKSIKEVEAFLSIHGLTWGMNI